MNIKIFSKDDIRTITIKDLELKVRPLTLSERLKIQASGFAVNEKGGFAPARMDYKSVIEAVAGAIIEIKGYEDYEPEVVLEGIQNPQDFYEIIRELKKINELEPEQEKK